MLKASFFSGVFLWWGGGGGGDKGHDILFGTKSKF